MDDDYIFKIILVGDHNTGKTTFMKKLINLDISSITTTIGVDYLIQHRKIDTKSIKINIWDTAGQERFKAIIINYFKGISGILLFFDLNNINTFNSLEKWIKEIHSKNPCDHDHPIFLIGNKSDLEQTVDDNLIDELIIKYNLVYHKISTLKNNVDDIFDLLIFNIYNNFIIKKIQCEGIRNRELDDNIVTIDLKKNNMTNKNKKYDINKCCIIG